MLVSTLRQEEKCPCTSGSTWDVESDLVDAFGFGIGDPLGIRFEVAETVLKGIGHAAASEAVFDDGQIVPEVENLCGGVCLDGTCCDVMLW